mmetsp:Transcript_36433/g.58753  ORF Transcript_36433/g.58753 Transcript_36433/m.58753 type:complete len:275 (-) Transcript_36433:3-827(-)
MHCHQLKGDVDDLVDPLVVVRRQHGCQTGGDQKCHRLAQKICNRTGQGYGPRKLELQGHHETQKSLVKTSTGLHQDIRFHSLQDHPDLALVPLLLAQLLLRRRCLVVLQGGLVREVHVRAQILQAEKQLVSTTTAETLHRRNGRAKLAAEEAKCDPVHHSQLICRNYQVQVIHEFVKVKQRRGQQAQDLHHDFQDRLRDLQALYTAGGRLQHGVGDQLLDKQVVALAAQRVVMTRALCLESRFPLRSQQGPTQLGIHGRCHGSNGLAGFEIKRS